MLNHENVAFYLCWWISLFSFIFADHFMKVKLYKIWCIMSIHLIQACNVDSPYMKEFSLTSLAIAPHTVSKTCASHYVKFIYLQIFFVHLFTWSGEGCVTSAPTTMTLPSLIHCGMLRASNAWLTPISLEFT